MHSLRDIYGEEDSDAPILEGPAESDPNFYGILGHNFNVVVLALRELAIRSE